MNHEGQKEQNVNSNSGGLASWLNKEDFGHLQHTNRVGLIYKIK